MKNSFRLCSVFIIMLMMNTNVFAWGWGGKKAMEPEDMAGLSSQMDSYMYNGMMSVIQRIESGEIIKDSPEAKIAMVKAIQDGFDHFGYSLDKTFRFIISQRSDYFWQRTVTQYGDLFIPMWEAMADDSIRNILIKQKIIAKETDEAWTEFAAWSKAVNN